MRFISYESVFDIGRADRNYVFDFLNFYSSLENIKKLLSDSFFGGFLLSPSPYSDNVCVCVGSHFNKYNFLKFYDSGVEFYIVQHYTYCQALWLPCEGVIYSANEVFANDILLFWERSKEELLELEYGSKLIGLINGCVRPYHYFYDSLPVLAELKFIDNVKFVDFYGADFLTGCQLGVDGSCVISLSNPNDVAGVCINPGYPIRFGKNKKYLRAQCDSWLLDRIGSVDKLGYPTVWVGICQEKREAHGLLEAVEKFLILVLKESPNAVIYLDGMTRPESIDVVSFRSKVDNEVAVINRIKSTCSQELGCSVGTNLISLSGATATEKIRTAQSVDFFITSALTDSIWCAKFGEKPGICWSGADIQKVKTEHFHPYTFFLSSVVDICNVQGGYSQETFSFDPEGLQAMFLSGLDFSVNCDKRDFVKLMSDKFCL